MSKEKKEHFINGIKVNEETAQAILNKSTYFPSDAENFELYNDFLNQQKAAFKATMNYFNRLLNTLRKQGKISGFMEFRTRIKSPESALRNDEINNIKLRTNDNEIKSKPVDDVFGMEFIGGTDKEVEFIVSIISKKTILARKNDKEKENGYKAKHRVFSLNKETMDEISKEFNIDPNNFPLFEAHFLTIAVALEANTGTAKHIDYKGLNPKEIQKKYNNNEFRVGYDVPQMWIGNGDKMVLLSSDETLQKMYPFLDLTQKGKEKHNKDSDESEPENS